MSQKNKNLTVEELRIEQKAETNINQNRVIYRPKINYKLCAINITTTIMIYVFLLLVLKLLFKVPTIVWIILPNAFLLAMLIIHAKLIVIHFIHLYQRYAKEETRLKCRFEPSCSEYMILAIQKYGFFKGIAKGIGRLKRCHYPNGGIDNP